VCAPGVAGAEASSDAERGRQLYLEANFEGARVAFEAVLASADLDRAGATEAHRFLAAISLIVGDAPGAARHAAAAVALTPTVTSPEGAPPELEGALDAAREELGEEGATLRISSDPEVIDSGDSAQVTARLEPSPVGLAAALQLRCAGEDVPPADAAGPPPSVAVTVAPARGASAVECAARAETDGGATLLYAEATIPVRGGSGGGEVLWWPWVVGAGGAAVIAAVVTVVVVVLTAPTDANIVGPQVEGW
jgi:hypothetical protein